MNLESVLMQYGVASASVTPLDGDGTINDVYRVSASEGEFVLKAYSALTEPDLTAERLDRICEAMALARDGGLPVPRVIPTRDGSVFVTHNGHYFVLTQFEDGRSYPAGVMPERAARQLGAIHARLLIILQGLGEAPAQELPSLEWVRAHLNRLLALGSLRRDNDPVDEAACLELEQKLRMLDAWRGPFPEIRAQWTHGDFQWRNALFNEEDEVVAVFDFDNLRAADAGRDVLRCFTLGFLHGSAEALAYFEGYAAASRITPDEARRYVNVYRYMSTYSVWPIDVRYLQPELYQSHWDQFIGPRPHSWESGWERLADELARIAGTGLQAGD